MPRRPPNAKKRTPPNAAVKALTAALSYRKSLAAIATAILAVAVGPHLSLAPLLSAVWQHGGGRGGRQEAVRTFNSAVDLHRAGDLSARPNFRRTENNT